MKAVKGNKDGENDSKMDWRPVPARLVRGSFIPYKEIRILWEYTRYRFKLVFCKTGTLRMDLWVSSSNSSVVIR